MEAGQGYQISNERSTPADEKAKKRWEAFEVLETARKRYDAAQKRRENARHELRTSECEAANSATALLKAQETLDGLMALSPENAEARRPRAESVPG